MDIILILVLGYLIGSIQPAFLMSKFIKKTDIREHGSNNSGASNMTMTFGWGYGVLTAVLDILKAYVPMLLLQLFFDYSLLISGLFGMMIVLGHIFPFYMQFKGGKGTASMMGFIFAINPLAGLVAFIGILVVTLVTGFIFIGTVIMYVFAMIMFWFLNVEISVIIVTLLLFMLSLYKHRINIKRIINKEETSLHSLLKKKE
jgi:glycerol-3-phosphate acyltransferase PlsY